MKAANIAIFLLAAIVSQASQKAAAQAGGLEMQIEYGYITGADTADEVLLDGNIFLKNISESSVNVVTGSIWGPRYSTGIIFYGATTTTNADGVPSKPSPGSLDITELKPKEITMLLHFRRRVKKAETKMIVAYSINKSVQDFYPAIWKGELKTNLTLQ